MALVLGKAELREVARTTFTWVDHFETQLGRVGRWSTAGQELDDSLRAASKQAAGFSWGTPDDVSAQVPRLVAALNDVAIHGGTVDAVTGAAKAPNRSEAIAAARRAHSEVQQALMARGWHPNGNEFNWP